MLLPRPFKISYALSYGLSLLKPSRGRQHLLETEHLEGNAVLPVELPQLVGGELGLLEPLRVERCALLKGERSELDQGRLGYDLFNLIFRYDWTGSWT